MEQDCKIEQLFSYALLCAVGYEKQDEYQTSLDYLFMNDATNDVLLELECKGCKDAILHTIRLMDELAWSTDEFGKALMGCLKPLYAETDLTIFSRSAYQLWKCLPETIAWKMPFRVFSYADDCLVYGDEKRCRRLYENAMNYYEADFSTMDDGSAGARI